MAELLGTSIYILPRFGVLVLLLQMSKCNIPYLMIGACCKLLNDWPLLAGNIREILLLFLTGILRQASVL